MSHSPVLFESDDENIDSINDVNIEKTNNTLVVEPLPGYVKDEACVRNLREILKGVPPPPNYTNLQLDISDLLANYCANAEILASGNERAPIETSKDLSVPEQLTSEINALSANKFGESAASTSNKNNILNTSSDSLRNNIPLRDYESLNWPAGSHGAGFDVFYNLGSISEELASLIDKFRERFISCETNSSFVMRSPLLTGSAKKRARRRAWGGYSPGRRLSHLAQRRRTFSSANLSLYSTNIRGRAILPGGSDNNKSAVSKKVIMVDMKSKNLQRAKSTSRIKDLNHKISKPNINHSKRALFQSPDAVTKNSSRKEKMLKTTPNKSRISKRALWPSSDKKIRRSAKKATPKKTVIEDSDEEGLEVININGKRLSNTSDGGIARKKCQKSLNFSSASIDEGTSNNQVSESETGQPRQCSPLLSQLHKQKMVWAVASSLKQLGINTSHELFRPAGTVLFKKCRQVWLQMLSNKKSEIKRSTSEQMFEIAVKYAAETIKKLKSATNSRASLSTENFVNISSISCEEKGKSGFSKVSDIFFNSVKNSKNLQDDSVSKAAEESESCSSVKQSAEMTDSNSNSHSCMSSEISFSRVRDEKSTELSNSEFSNSTTDDSIEKNLRNMFDGCVNNSIKFSVASNSPINLPKIFDEESQISQLSLISTNIPSGRLKISIDKLSSDSVSNKLIKSEEQLENIDHSLRNIVENLKTEVESLNENDSGFIDNESTSKPSKSFDVKVSKNNIQSPTTFTATVSKELSPVKLLKNEIQPTAIFSAIISNESLCNSGKENQPLAWSDSDNVISVTSVENATFRFKKFGSSAENMDPLSEKELNNKNTNVLSSAHFDETAMSSCDISVIES